MPQPLHLQADQRLELVIDQFKQQIYQINNIDRDLIFKAFEFSQKAHHGQFRSSGDYFFIHPVRIAIKIAEYTKDTNTIIAALLHDIIEDTKYCNQELVDLFGATVASIVEALTKVKTSKKLTLKKIFKLADQDFRVILIKLMDRLDNLEDLKFLPRKKQRLICLESLVVYAEVAHGFGLIKLEEQLKNLIFRVFYPLIYQKIETQLQIIYHERAEAIKQIINNIKSQIPAHLVIKIEPQFTTAQQFIKKRNQDLQILKNIKIIVYTPQNCYEILGYLHIHFRCIPLNIRDYISNPKANGWRGLETQLIIEGEYVNISIITESFDLKNSYGVITLIQEKIYQAKEYQDFINLYLDIASEDVRIEDIFRRRKERTIQILTPKGRFYELRYGATVLDFAYMVHSDLGLHCNGAIINNVRYPRNKILEDGMIVQVLADETVLPEKTWLDYIVMPKARKEMIKFLNKDH